MIPELGYTALILALFLCLLPIASSLLSKRYLGFYPHRSNRWLVSAIFILIAVAFGSLVCSFLRDDFTVNYVAGHSNRWLPWYYKISAVWGGHEGSMLLWVWVLSGWMSMVSWKDKQLPKDLGATVIGSLSFVVFGSLLFLLTSSNPFERSLLFVPTTGTDLNPLLQDFGLIIHPPILYMGYIGFAVVFAFAIAALVHQKLDQQWATWVRPWANYSWAFLTVGIALGSWWAYYELGWGGWWFWDPVENASLMPWLAGAALIHSLLVVERQPLFRRWVLLLSIGAFGLSLLGTFLVRSGILTSVHAFASDPTRGVFIILFLALVIGGALLLYGLRVNRIETQSDWSPLWSREMILLINNMGMILLLFVVLLGTLYPLLYELLGFGFLSVGAPYFNLFVLWFGVPLVLFMTLGTYSLWGKGSFRALRVRLQQPAVYALIGGLLWPALYGFGGDYPYSYTAMLGATLALWILLPLVVDIFKRTRTRNWGESWQYWGMVTAHAGLAVLIIGISFSSAYSINRDLQMKAGDTAELGGYRFELSSYQQVQGANYTADEASFRVHRDKNSLLIKSQKRQYYSGANTMTEAGIDGGLFRDLYITMGEKIGTNPESWSIRFHVKPFIRFIWAGAFLIALGAVLATIRRQPIRVKVN